QLQDVWLPPQISPNRDGLSALLPNRAHNLVCLVFSRGEVHRDRVAVRRHHASRGRANAPTCSCDYHRTGGLLASAFVYRQNSSSMHGPLSSLSENEITGETLCALGGPSPRALGFKVFASFDREIPPPRTPRFARRIEGCSLECYVLSKPYLERLKP